MLHHAPRSHRNYPRGLPGEDVLQREKHSRKSHGASLHRPRHVEHRQQEPRAEQHEDLGGDETECEQNGERLRSHRQLQRHPLEKERSHVVVEVHIIPMDERGEKESPKL